MKIQRAIDKLYNGEILTPETQTTRAIWAYGGIALSAYLVSKGYSWEIAPIALGSSVLLAPEFDTFMNDLFSQSQTEQNQADLENLPVKRL